MKFLSRNLDGGSLMIALIVAGGTTAALSNNWRQLDALSLVVGISLSAIITGLFIWQSVRIGRNRQRIRDTARWMGDKTETESVT